MMTEDIFSECKEIAKCFEVAITDDKHIEKEKEKEGRDKLLHLLGKLKDGNEQYSPIINHLIRISGLFPYMEPKTSDWQDRFAYGAFKLDAGALEPSVLHREQSRILKLLLEGKDLFISAPTSFGKSFVIDVFISIKKPANVVIIVPTIALIDETRRRLIPKFGSQYKIVTQTDVDLGDNYILIVTQERAIGYLKLIKNIDILIVDEFYKVGKAFDSDRSQVLIKALQALGRITTQKYVLAPNIDKWKDNDKVLGWNLAFESVDFNTVFLNIFKPYTEIEEKMKEVSGEKKPKQYRTKFKTEQLLKLLPNCEGKSLIYANAHSQVEILRDVCRDNFKSQHEISKCISFAEWLELNYGERNSLSDLVKIGIGVHTGRIHRSLSQIQIKLFEEEKGGLEVLLTTSSIIEGVNTSAKNVIIWEAKIGKKLLNIFTYKNIIGRSGRMFKHFIGNVYLLAKEPQEENTELQLEFQAESMVNIDEVEEYADTAAVNIIKQYALDMIEIMGKEHYKEIKKDSSLKLYKPDFIKKLSGEIYSAKKSGAKGWKQIKFLNGKDVNDWERPLGFCLGKLVKTKHLSGGLDFDKIINFTKIASQSWDATFPELMGRFNEANIEEKQYFQLEKFISYELASGLAAINMIYKQVEDVDINTFVYNISHAFLPRLVFQLEEYGLPRMMSRKIHDAKIINLENSKDANNKPIEIHEIIAKFKENKEDIIDLAQKSHPFDKYIMDYFYKGIEVNQIK